MNETKTLLNASCGFNVTTIDTLATVKFGFGKTASIMEQDVILYQVVKEKGNYFMAGNSLKLLVVGGVAIAQVPVSQQAHEYIGKYLIVQGTDKKGNTTSLQSVLIQ